MDGPVVLELPRLRALVGRALPRLTEAVIVPLAIFYLAFWAAGVQVAFAASLGWTYAVFGWRLVVGRRVPGVLVLAVSLQTARTAIAMASGSPVLYFLQPTFGTLLVAAVFLASVPLGHPLVARLAHDFCPLPIALMERSHVRTVFARLTLLWAGTHIANAALSIWLLVSQPISTYVIVRNGASLAVTGVAILVSTAFFVRSMRDLGVQVRFARPS